MQFIGANEVNRITGAGKGGCFREKRPLRTALFIIERLPLGTIPRFEGSMGQLQAGELAIFHPFSAGLRIIL
jgi:hypothetical protein